MDANGNLFRWDDKLNVHNALPFTHSLHSVTAYRIKPKLSGRQGTWGPPRLSLSPQPYFLPLCLPTTLEIIAVPLMLCFCPASGPDTCCSVAHNLLLDSTQTPSGHHPWVDPSKLSISTLILIMMFDIPKSEFPAGWSHIFSPFIFVFHCPTPRKYSVYICWICQSQEARIKIQNFSHYLCVMGIMI